MTDSERASECVRVRCVVRWFRVIERAEQRDWLVIVRDKSWRSSRWFLVGCE